MKYFDRTPNDIVTKTAWEIALNGQECSSSQWVCSEHFNPDDYTVSQNKKKFILKAGVIPTVFEVFLIEVEENDYEYEEINNNISIFHHDEEVPSDLNVQTCGNTFESENAHCTIT